MGNVHKTHSCGGKAAIIEPEGHVCFCPKADILANSSVVGLGKWPMRALRGHDAAARVH
jgi:hypothetical protein